MFLPLKKHEKLEEQKTQKENGLTTILFLRSRMGLNQRPPD